MEFRKLGEFCTVKGGKRLPKGTQLQESKTNHPYLRIKDFNNGNIDINNLMYISEEVFNKISNYTINKGNIFLSIVGTIGLVDVIEEELDKSSLTENAVKIYSNDEKQLSTEFLSYYLKSTMGQHEISIRTVGSTQPKLAITRIKDINVPMIDIKKQYKITWILSNIDKKIKLNRTIIANLEELSQTLFKRWFIDFEFADKNGNPYKSSGGEMVDSELGKIPKYWKVSNLDKIASFVSRGITPKYNENSDIQIPIINQKVNKGPRLDLQYIKYFDGQNRIKKELYAQKNDLLLNSLGQGTLGRIHLFTRKSEEFLIDQHISIIRFDNINYSYFYYAHINTDLIQGQIDSLISGSTGMLMLNITKIRNLKVILPTEELVLKYSKLVNEYFGKITQLIYENENLTQLRDALLPKLMSGEIDIPDDIEVNEDELSI
ncbi:restriction endonuclease subunit S [Staphylococcus epidermidis]|uniref:restriction endonuclease subunit S n=2 Tax=Staphylococcus TaxID=1279 RepID=UPI0020959720|nr:restriction endonuclease subunit S [Staphylococcus epidermidis]MCO6332790.1 restriction endonuclease subunit S [Staphylococcus epidermidis]